MRFTKIPLIATLMAVALSLLIVLPGLAQQTTDITDGRQGNGVISVGVFDSIEDAQLAKLRDAAGAGLAGGEAGVYVPIAAGTTATNIGAGVDGVNDGTDPAFLADRRVDPQNTFFRNSLYASNSGDAFNVVLINVDTSGVADYGDSCVVDNDATADVNEREAGTARVTATVRNNRSGGSVTIELVRTPAGGADSLNPDASGAAVAGDYAQAFFKIVDRTATIDHDSDSNTAEIGFTQHGGPTWCDNAATREFDETPDDDTDALTEVQIETTATAAQYAPTGYTPTTVAAPPATQEIATIFARHGDRLTITASNGSGQVELVVDGEGPDFSAITPDDNAVTTSKRLVYSFEVRDDDSGLRHDGESVISNDGDREEINPDGDQNLASEPLSEDPDTAVNTNGRAEDIDVRVVMNPNDETGTTPLTADTDLSASGEWRIAGSRAGVAYAFTASGADKRDNPYLYQLRARDRAGNWTVTDGDDSDAAPGNQAFVFRVDNTDPALVGARTGITWDGSEDEEVVDRSYIALEFTGNGAPDALGDVDTNNITVVGHTIVGYIHPSEAPAINRNEPAPRRGDFDDQYIRYTPVQPTATRPSLRTDTAEAAAWATAQASTDQDRTNADVTLLLLEGRWVKYEADNTAVTTAIANDANADVPAPVAEDSASGTSDPTECATPLTIATSAAVQRCGEWDQYTLDKAEYDKGVDAKDAGDDLFDAAVEAHTNAANPGTRITGDGMDTMVMEPRSMVYVELADALASDETPTVLVVGGAVFDLAGNTNDAVTLDNEVVDWIAPGLTVTVTGTMDDRPVANTDDGSFTVDVRSDEDLGSRPTVYFVSLASALNEDEDGYDYTIAGRDPAARLTQQEDENHWQKKYNASSIEDIGAGLIGVIVVADDEEDNSGATAGWSPRTHRNSVSPTAGHKLNVGKMDSAGLLVEIDDEFNNNVDPVGAVTPRSNDDGTETESSSPFVKLSFTAEGGEYDACPEDEDGDSDCASGVDAVEDSHDNVNVTEVTLNGENAMASLNRVNANEFSLVTRDLAVDTHTVTYTAVDDAGNEYEGEFEFDVKERQPYEIAVSPGWNLVSLPATPLEPAIDAVLADNQYISPVLGYQEGDWITAVREEDGTWRGRLTEIVGGYGYWVHARTFESIETMLSEVDPAGTLPTVPVTAGWNLLGVLDIFQNDEGTPPGASVPDPDGGDPTVGEAEADDYFSSIPWKVAYTYSTSHSLWLKTVPEDEDDMADENTGEIENGNGYWVWSSTPGTLVP